jgi:hypothetical protein
MRALRERPRLAAAKLAALIATALVAEAIASDDPDASPDLEPRLERSAQLRHKQTGGLRRLAAQLAGLRTDLRRASRRARIGVRTSERLRRDLLAARRSLARGGER